VISTTAFLNQRKRQRKTDIWRQNCNFDMAKLAWVFLNIDIKIGS
jgi:hypothetical protein